MKELGPGNGGIWDCYHKRTGDSLSMPKRSGMRVLSGLGIEYVKLRPMAKIQSSKNSSGQNPHKFYAKTYKDSKIVILIGQKIY